LAYKLYFSRIVAPRTLDWQESRHSRVHWAVKLKSRDFHELAVTYGLVLLALWTPNPLQTWLCWVILAWVVSATVASGQDAHVLGLRPSGLPRSLWVIGIAMLTAILAVWIAAQVHTFHPVLSGGSRFWGYLLWAFLQQFLLQDFFLLRLLRLLPTKTGAVIAAAVLFSSAHIPNPLLIVVTLLWGAATCALFLRYRDLYSLGIAHGILGICLAVTVPNPVHHGMRVGLGYLRYHEQREALHHSQSNHIVSTDAWVIADAKRRCPSLQALP
jgi:Type II CAAX prenyl endopeptidase Rce1-like